MYPPTLLASSGLSFDAPDSIPVAGRKGTANAAARLARGCAVTFASTLRVANRVATQPDSIARTRRRPDSTERRIS